MICCVIFFVCMKIFDFTPYHTRCIHSGSEEEARKVIAECVEAMNAYIAENQAYKKEVFDNLLEQIKQGVATLHKEVDSYYSLKVA
ncbi:MAG: hypothetical protein EAZ95_10650 [Bacteroidetes bacterium]|nr:MAG: hypothetical protein EAZ95_10650 [Bacteroidota bacterium]